MTTYKDVPGFDGYRVGDDGSIWSQWNNKWGRGEAWRQLKPGANNKYGRQVVCIRTARGETCSFQLHKLILLSFVGPCPDGMECLHADGDASNNCLSNISWGTPSENDADMREHGKKKGEKHHNAVLNDDLVRTIRARAATGESHQSIADDLGFNRRNISRVVDRSRWSHVA